MAFIKVVSLIIPCCLFSCNERTEMYFLPPDFEGTVLVVYSGRQAEAGNQVDTVKVFVDTSGMVLLDLPRAESAVSLQFFDGYHTEHRLYACPEEHPDSKHRCILGMFDGTKAISPMIKENGKYYNSEDAERIKYFYFSVGDETKRPFHNGKTFAKFGRGERI